MAHGDERLLLQCADPHRQACPSRRRGRRGSGPGRTWREARLRVGRRRVTSGVVKVEREADVIHPGRKGASGRPRDPGFTRDAGLSGARTTGSQGPLLTRLARQAAAAREPDWAEPRRRTPRRSRVTAAFPTEPPRRPDGSIPEGPSESSPRALRAQ